MAPPYLFSGSSVGLMQIPAIIGFIIACFAGGYAADIITATVIRRQRGAVYAEQRLIALIPGCVFAPIGCILIAFACSEKLHWVAIAFGFGLGQYSSNINFLVVLTAYQCHSERFTVLILPLHMLWNATQDSPQTVWLRSMYLKTL